MSSDPAAELDRVARSHRQAEGFTPRLVACRARTLEAILPPGRILDLGCADGLLTAALAARHRQVVGVDASPVRLERARRRTAGLGNVELRRALFEDFAPRAGERFDGAVLSCVLEHLAAPTPLLERVATWLAPGGRAVAIVPHARSLHRRAGVLMGLLAHLDDLGAGDEALDHLRVYDLERLSAELTAAGFRVVARGGHLLKPLPNSRMAELDEALLAAYETLGRELPDLASEIFAVGEIP